MKMKAFYFIPFLILACSLASFVKNNTENGNSDKFIVVLDAGHGGHDPGNLGNGYLEKNIALNIVLKVGEILEKNPDIEVIYTRKDDTFVDLYVRGEIANKANADLFVSVHCDSHTSNANGAGTFVLGLHANKQNFEIAKKENSVIYLEDNYQSRYADYDINSPESVIGLTIMQEEFLDQSIMLAKIMQDKFSNELKRNDRKVKQAGFIVLHQTFMPSVLVETGFLTNKSEGSYLNSKSGQSQMGKAIADAILSYRNSIKTDDVAKAAIETPEVKAVSSPETDTAKELAAQQKIEKEEAARKLAEAQEAEKKEIAARELAAQQKKQKEEAAKKLAAQEEADRKAEAAIALAAQQKMKDE
ncbi:MAG: N-acetylmuramoyl-L-alanine amidase, partial [Bacteroidota bacterium]